MPKAKRDSLYERSVLHENCKHEILEAAKESRELHELDECTHKPLVNPISEKIVSRIDKEELKQRIK